MSNTTTQKTRPNYAPELRQRAVRMVLDYEGDYPSRWAAIESVAMKIGCAGVRKVWRQLKRESLEVARYFVGWRRSRSAHAGFVLDALEQAIHDRRSVNKGGLIHYSDRGSQDLSIKHTERLAEAGIEPTVGSVGDSYDNALAETINGLYKAEVIHRRAPWRSFEAVEFVTLEWAG
jgi:hypothetical protein